MMSAEDIVMPQSTELRSPRVLNEQVAIWLTTEIEICTFLAETCSELVKFGPDPSEVYPVSTASFGLDQRAGWRYPFSC